jgi:hypothetical protein
MQCKATQKDTNMNKNVTLSVKQIFTAATLIVLFTSSVFLVGFQFGSKNVGAVPSGVTSSYLPLSKGGTGDNKFIGNDATHALAGNTKASDIGGASYLQITDWSLNAIKNLDLIDSHVYMVFASSTVPNSPTGHKYAGTLFKDSETIYINVSSAAAPSSYARRIAIGTSTDSGWKLLAGYPKTGSINWTSGTVTRSNVRQDGNQVYINFEFSALNLTTTRVKIGTISGVSMPTEVLNCIGFANSAENNSVRFEVNTSGEILVDATMAATGRAVDSTCTYIVSQ